MLVLVCSRSIGVRSQYIDIRMQTLIELWHLHMIIFTYSIHSTRYYVVTTLVIFSKEGFHCNHCIGEIQIRRDVFGVHMDFRLCESRGYCIICQIPEVWNWKARNQLMMRTSSLVTREIRFDYPWDETLVVMDMVHKSGYASIGDRGAHTLYNDQDKKPWLVSLAMEKGKDWGHEARFFSHDGPIFHGDEGVKVDNKNRRQVIQPKVVIAAILTTSHQHESPTTMNRTKRQKTRTFSLLSIASTRTMWTSQGSGSLSVWLGTPLSPLSCCLSPDA